MLHTSSATSGEQDVIDICLRLPDASIGWLAFCS